MAHQQLLSKLKSKVKETKDSKTSQRHELNKDKIHSLRKDIASLKKLVVEVATGGAKNDFKDPKIRIAAQHLEPKKLLQWLTQLNFRKNHELDRLKSERDECLATVTEIKRQMLISQNEESVDTLCSLSRLLEQSLVLNIQNAMMKKNVANHINNIYRAILDVLAKDLTKFGSKLEKLRAEYQVLCKDLLSATEINQYLREHAVGLRDRQQELEAQAADVTQQQDQAVREMRARVHRLERQARRCVLARQQHQELNYKEEKDALLPDVGYMMLLKKLDQLDSLLEELKMETRLTNYQDVFLRMRDPFLRKCDVDLPSEEKTLDTEVWLFSTIDNIMTKISKEEYLPEDLPGEAAAAMIQKHQKEIQHLRSRLASLRQVLHDVRPYTELALQEADEMVETFMSDLDAFV